MDECENCKKLEKKLKDEYVKIRALTTLFLQLTEDHLGQLETTMKDADVPF